jgi:hypothetical protein
MPGMKTAGWYHLQHAMRELTDAANEYLMGKRDDADNRSAAALSNLAYGTERSLQELYERMERLHQKIDRMEKKIGSAPGAK